jgi:hypothetical protein
MEINFVEKNEETKLARRDAAVDWTFFIEQLHILWLTQSWSYFA